MVWDSLFSFSRSLPVVHLQSDQTGIDDLMSVLISSLSSRQAGSVLARFQFRIPRNLPGLFSLISFLLGPSSLASAHAGLDWADDQWPGSLTCPPPTWSPAISPSISPSRTTNLKPHIYPLWETSHPHTHTSPPPPSIHSIVLHAFLHLYCYTFYLLSTTFLCLLLCYYLYVKHNLVGLDPIVLNYLNEWCDYFIWHGSWWWLTFWVRIR